MGSSGWPDKRKKERQRHNEELVATSGQKRKRPPTKEAIDQVEKLLQALCLNHRYLIRPAYKDSGLLRKFLGGGMPLEKG